MNSKSIIEKKRSGILMIIFSTGLWHLIIAFSNITDYWTNFEFVKHVLTMDTIFPSSKVMYRSISQTWLHHSFYWIIIILELTIAYCFLFASYRIYASLKSSSTDFMQAKSKAFTGIFFGMILWFLSFSVIGAEWFSMWQSSEWNATQTAKLNLLVLMGVYAILVIID